MRRDFHTKQDNSVLTMTLLMKHTCPGKSIQAFMFICLITITITDQLKLWFMEGYNRLPILQVKSTKSATETSN